MLLHFATQTTNDNGTRYDDATMQQHARLTKRAAQTATWIGANMKDIRYLQPRKYLSIEVLPYMALFALLSATLYFAERFRGLHMMNRDMASDEQRKTWLLYFIAELGIFLPNMLYNVVRSMAISGRRHAPRLEFTGIDGPTIDVFITCAGEDFATIIRTVRAACASDYIRDLFRVIVLDDAASDELRREVHQLQKSNHNLFYTAREKGKNHGFKAGNLNHGFKYVENLPGGAGEYVASLDADMIPSRRWLRALLPHLLLNEEVGVAAGPQSFYVTPSNDLLLQGLEVNYRIHEPLKHAAGAAWCLGSGYLIRRACLDQVGGVPTSSIGEDMCLSNILLGQGWQGIYVDEDLQYGQVPETLASHLKQQVRWQIGRIQVGVVMNFYLWGDVCREMTIRQRVVGLLSLVLAFASISTTVGLVALLLALGSQEALLPFQSTTQLQWLLFLSSVYQISEWLVNYTIAIRTGYDVAMREDHASLWVAPYIAVGVIRAFFLPSWLGGNVAGFTSSGTIDSEINERSAHRRAPFFPQRLRYFFYDNCIGLHAIYIVICCTYVARRMIQALNFWANTEGTDDLSKHTLLYITWVPALWYICIISFMAPIHYACFPPNASNQDELLQWDDIHQASWPKNPVVVKEQGDWWDRLTRPGVQYTISVVYTVVVGILTLL